MGKPDYLNFEVDHMTLLLHPQLYNLSYLIFRIIFGSTATDLLYEKRRTTLNGEVSMTYATCIGVATQQKAVTSNTIIAVVQPSEPLSEPSHVREMLDGHHSAAHWQHIALRTPNLVEFYRHASELGVQFV